MERDLASVPMVFGSMIGIGHDTWLLGLLDFCRGALS